jgi:GxxExxY protein
LELDDISDLIIGKAIEIHKNLGPGLLEAVYETVLASLLEKEGLKVKKQMYIDFEYEGILFKEGFKLDLLVEDKVIIELKSVEKINPVHSKQLLTYLRLMNLEVGLLINFGCATLKDGLHRIVNNHIPSASSRLRVNQERKNIFTRGGAGFVEKEREKEL